VGEINKTVATTTKLDIKWISGAETPEAPEGYERLSELDLTIQFSILDIPLQINLWAFKKT
jgi:hypothetical protein